MNKPIRTLTKVMMTGGHITPAVATIEELREKYPDWEILFVGRKSALEGHITHSEEYRLIRGLGLKFLPIMAGRLKREGGLRAVMGLTKLPVGIFQALWYVGWYKPALVISFGGYIALPVVLAAWTWRVPVITHEQTMRPGLTNRIIAHLAEKICISFPDTVSQFSGNKHIVITGLPVRQHVLRSPKKAPFPIHPTMPLLLIVGGSTGSTSINEVVFAALPELLRTYTVVHQVGRISERRASDVESNLSPAQRDRYLPVPYLSTDAYSYLLHKAALIIGRSGANTVTEIALCGKVAVFIPLPWAGGNEQYYNAKVLEDAGSAVILEQKNFSGESLIKHVHTIMKELPERNRKAKSFVSRIPHDGVKRFVAVIAKTLGV